MKENKDGQDFLDYLDLYSSELYQSISNQIPCTDQTACFTRNKIEQDFLGCLDLYRSSTGLDVIKYIE